MEKIFEKKNLGIPATLLTVLTYFIGYYIANDYTGFLVAILFAVVVFALDFDDKVKTAVKQSYIVGLICCLIYLALDIVYQLSTLVSSIYILSNITTKLYTYAHTLFNIAVIVIFALFIILALIGKDMKLNFILNLLGEGTPKQKPVQQPVPPMYQQPVPPMPQNQPMYQQPVPPMPQQSAPQPAQEIRCSKCGAVNKAGAAFCASCGTKL
jgi:hypothetical protein